MSALSCPHVATPRVWAYTLLFEAMLCTLAHAADVSLPPVPVTAGALRPDLERGALVNPYRVEPSSEAGTEVFNREDIAALAPKDVLDLLDKATGMNLTYQGRKSPYFLDQRGGGSLTYVLDGAILPTSNNRILQKIPLGAIEQIQIVRGSTSLALGPSIPIGSSASGSGVNTGFVIIRTRRPQGTEAQATAAIEKATVQPAADNESLYVGQQVNAGQPVEGHVAAMVTRRQVTSRDDWFDGQNAEAQMATGGVTLDRLSVNVTGYQDEGRFEMQRGVTVTGALDTSKWYYDPIKTKVLTSESSMAWSDNQVTLLSLYRTEYDQTEHDDSFTSTTVTAPKQFQEKTSGYNLRHNARFGDTVLHVSHERTGSKGFGPNTSNSYNNWQTDVSGWSAAVEQALFEQRLQLDVGYRRDRKHLDRSATSAAKLGADNDVSLAPARVWTVGATWHMTAAWALIGRHFKGDEGTAGDFDIRTQGGTPLHPELQRRDELTLDGDVAAAFHPALTYYDVQINNQKTATTNTYVDQGNTYYYYTEASSHRRGLEVSAKGDLAPRTSYRLSVTHQMQNSTTSGVVTTDNIGLGQPVEMWTIDLRHGWGPYRANLSAKHVSGWTSTTASPGTVYNLELGNYLRVDTNLSRDFLVDGHRVSVEAYIRNLTGSHYVTRYVTGYYPDRGRTLGLQFDVRL